ncbi:hypothetical protein [Actinokineospora xionganensis]|uniref:Uncharacterized protein n=1 Tax=Actinokineospora xionganensis TaxID=2684470 RepID=A0ABR7LAP6_9PSEU|nr:hypothetical protein [Actinokineospora xionganensis]MBC6449789.1 hypothetical protein [Actinokineospora xionganensis]
MRKELGEQGHGRSRRRMLIVVPPGQADGDGRGAEETEDEAGSWVLVDGALGGDADAATGGDHGEPVVDVLGVFDSGPALRWPQVGAGDAGAPVDDETAFGDLGESE